MPGLLVGSEFQRYEVSFDILLCNLYNTLIPLNIINIGTALPNKENVVTLLNIFMEAVSMINSQFNQYMVYNLESINSDS